MCVGLLRSNQPEEGRRHNYVCISNCSTGMKPSIDVYFRGQGSECSSAVGCTVTIGSDQVYANCGSRWPEIDG